MAYEYHHVRRWARDYEIGQIMNANLPVKWRKMLGEPINPFKTLLNWVFATEQQIYSLSNTAEEYFKNVDDTIIGSALVHREYKQDNEERALVPVDHDSYTLAQIAMEMMSTAKKGLTAFRDQEAYFLLSATCGLLDLPYPSEQFINQRISNIVDMPKRRKSCYFLLLTIFPEVDEECEHTEELIEFGKKVEEEIWKRSETMDDYYAFIWETKTRIMEIRIFEDLRLMGIIPQEEEMRLTEVRNNDPNTFTRERAAMLAAEQEMQREFLENQGFFIN